MRSLIHIIFLVVAMVFTVGEAVQAQPTQPVQSFSLKMPVRKWSNPNTNFLLTKKDTTIAQPAHLPLNFYATHLGAACKVELQMEKQTKLPLRIRLGSKDQVDYLEGKYNRNR